MPLLMILGDLQGHLRCFNFYSAGKLDIDAVMSCTRKQMNVATHHRLTVVSIHDNDANFLKASLQSDL